MQKDFSLQKQKGMDVLYFVARELKRETLGLLNWFYKMKADQSLN